MIYKGLAHKAHSHAGSNSNIFSSWSHSNLNNNVVNGFGGNGGGGGIGSGGKNSKIQPNSWGPSPVQNGWGSG